MIEYDQAAIRKVPEKKVLINHVGRSSISRGKEKENCWIHTAEKHPIWVCQTFKVMQPQERRVLTEEKGACIGCPNWTICNAYGFAPNHASIVRQA